MGDCTQTNIPEVDNTLPECDEFISTECVIMDEAIPFIGSEEDSPLKDVILLMIEKMKKQQRLINNLRSEIETLLNN